MTTPKNPTAGEQGSPPEPWMVKLVEEALAKSCRTSHPADYCRYPMDAPREIAWALAPYLHAPARSQSGEGVFKQTTRDCTLDELVETLGKDHLAAQQIAGLRAMVLKNHKVTEQDCRTFGSLALMRENFDQTARIASLETEAKDLRRMLDRTAEEAFGLDDTIGLEPYDEYFIRQVAKLRAAARPADSVLVEVPEWVAVPDGLPPLDLPVWLYLPNIGQPLIGSRCDDGDGWLWCRDYHSPWYDRKARKWHCGNAEADDILPSHWMHLPHPPLSVQAPRPADPQSP